MKGNKCCPICPLTLLLSFVAYVGMGYMVHNVLLMGTYKITSDLWATQEFMQKNWHYQYIGSFIFSLFAAIIFRKGYEGRGLVEGLRFGIYFGLAIGSLHITMYPFNKYPVELAFAWAFGDMLQAITIGVVLAAFYSIKGGSGSCDNSMCEAESCATPVAAPKKKAVSKKSGSKKKK